jgi:hypothetical protein
METEQRPIIILGAARSGTRFLRDTLGASSEISIVPYDVNYIWRTGNEACRHDEMSPDLCSEALAARIRKELYRAARKSGTRTTGRLLEKTVSNTLRVEFVSRVFPDADLVHLIRDGREVVASSLRQWGLPIDHSYLLGKLRAFSVRNYRYAFWYAVNRIRGTTGQDGRVAIWGVRYAGIEEDLRTQSLAEVCARQWLASVTSVREAAARLPGIRLREIRYESLLESPRALKELAGWLGLQDIDPVIRRYSDTLRPHAGEPWNRQLDPRDASAVSGIIGPLQAELGYR